MHAIKFQMLLLMVGMPLWLCAQDLLELKDKNIINARIIQEDKESVVYIMPDDPGRSVKRIPAEAVKKIKYEKVPKSVNVIEILHDSLENEYLLNDIINHLIVSGYVIDEFDNRYYTVSTEYDQNDRMTVEINSNKASFRCFHLDENEEIYPHVRATITWGKKPKPGEKRSHPGSMAFKKLDAVSRSYLKDGKGTLTYKTEETESDSGS